MKDLRGSRDRKQPARGAQGMEFRSFMEISGESLCAIVKSPKVLVVYIIFKISALNRRVYHAECTSVAANDVIPMIVKASHTKKTRAHLLGTTEKN